MQVLDGSEFSLDHIVTVPSALHAAKIYKYLSFSRDGNCRVDTAVMDCVGPFN
jgi:hypothetical protein